MLLGTVGLLGAFAVVSAVPGGPMRLAQIGQLKVAEAAGAPRPPRALPETAEAFADSVGVVVHLTYSDSGYRDWPQVDRALQYLGVRNLREHAPLPANTLIEHVHAAARAGYRFTFLVFGQAPLADSVAALADFHRRYPNAIAAIEGPNEINNFPFPYRGQNGDAAGQRFQSDLYAAIKADPELRGIPLYNLTSWPDLAGKADVANFHSYAHEGAQARAGLLGDMARQQAVMPGKPVVLTEAGYHNTIAAGTWEGVDQATSAPLILNLLFDAWSAGISSVHLYQLLDAYPDPAGKDMERHFGLFDIDYRPKVAATALRNLLLALRERAAAGARLGTAAVSAGPDDLATLQLSRGDGARIVIAYRRAPLWDTAADKPLTVAPATVTLTPPEGARTVTIHDPVLGTRSERAIDGDVLTLPLAADPLVLAFRGDPVVAAKERDRS
ncbi:MAG: hypothetical protein ABW203_06970 [Novosphingobium sp.]